MTKQKCKCCGSTNDLITPLSSMEHCCMNRHCMNEFSKEHSANRNTSKKCDLCRKDKPICPTGLGDYLGEKNPDLCDECKDILQPLSETVIKLIIREITKED
jgi:hypothetical protein